MEKFSWKEIREPEYTGVSYDQRPKVRGFFIPAVVAFITLLIAAFVPTAALYAGYFAIIKFAQIVNTNESGHFVGPSFKPFSDTFPVLYLFSIMFEFVRGTGPLCYFACRTEKSIVKSMLIAMFIKRYSSGKAPQMVFFQK